MLAHSQGSLLNASALARALAVDGKTVASYLDLLVDLLLVRRLAPWHGNVRKRLVKSPKVYVRDSGLVHALLGVGDREALPAHPVADGSWEGLGVESLIAAMLLPDSLPYRTLADSNGRFAFGPLPRGTFLVTAVVDQDRNRRRGGKESWDSVRVGTQTDLVGEIWAFPRDTTPPRIQSAERVDSFTIGIVLTQTLDPRFALPADSIRVVQLPDSSSIGPIGALPQPAHDSLYRGRGGLTPAKAPDDTAAAKADSAPPVVRPPAVGGRRPGGRPDPAAPPPDSLEQVRPPLTTRLMVRTAGIVQGATSYVVELHGVRTIGGGTAATLRVRVEGRKPAPAKADSLAAKKDSTAKPRPDSTSGRPARP